MWSWPTSCWLEPQSEGVELLGPDGLPISSRYLSQDDRIETADGLAAGEPVKVIAARIGKSYQTHRPRNPRGSAPGRLLAAGAARSRPGPPVHIPGGRRVAYARLRRWAHMLGFGGHYSTKSRRYSTTLTALRDARSSWRRQHTRRHERGGQPRETTLLVGDLAFAGVGWRTTGDALLATTSAARARVHRRAVREELAHNYGRRRVQAA